MGTHFNTLVEARKYVREMSEQATAKIGGDDVWEHEPTRAVAVATADELIEEGENSDEWRRLGTVAEVLY
jgi:hypothetical protein